MPTERPRVIGLRELLRLKKSLRETPAPLVYFSNREWRRLIKGAVELPRRPRGAPLAAFDPWPGGGMVQGKCESPEGQICFGRWTPAGPDHGAGIYFGCVCRATKKTPPPPRVRCQLLLAPTGQLSCAGTCDGLDLCQLLGWRDPATGRYVLDCRCTGGAIVLASPRARRRRTGARRAARPVRPR